MRVLLKDSPRGPEFIGACLNAAADMALAFVGEPDEKVCAHLEATLMKTLPAQLEKHFDAETSALITQAMVKAILGQKHELESRGFGIA
jgi:hypothetical protein